MMSDELGHPETVGDEGASKGGASAMSRRGFLRTGAAAAGASMLAGPASRVIRGGGARIVRANPLEGLDLEGIELPDGLTLSDDGTVVGYGDTPHLPWAPEWRKHDPNRPWPPRITPGEPCCPDSPAFGPPEDAIVLFDGSDTDMWAPNEWEIENGELVAYGDDIVTRDSFGDCQLHVEWSAPDPPRGAPGDQGNSGVFMMSRYEIQILDSYNLPMYADGIAGAVYGETPPMAHPMRPPGEWNEFDILFTAPVFEDGEVLKPATLTMFFNGLLVHYNTVIHGPVSHRTIREYEPHGAKEPLSLQEHNNPVRFRNIWIRPLDDLGDHAAV